MQLLKTVDKLIARREKLAYQLSEVSLELDEWLKKNEIKTEEYDRPGGAEMFANPTDSANRIRKAILQHEEN